jgi:MFS family permease
LRLAATQSHRRHKRLGLGVLPERLGLPDLGSARPFAFALAVDAFGSGLFLPFSLLYFHHVGGLSLTQAGLGLSIAMLMAVPAPLFAGVLLDRSSPKRIMLLTNTARVAGFLGFLFVHDLWALIAVALLVAVSDRLFWVAHPALVAELAGSGGRDRWFGLTTALRCAGLGTGGLLAGLVISDLGTLGYQSLAIANAISYAVAALLISRLEIPSHGQIPLAASVSRQGGLKAVLADRAFCGLVAINLLFGIARTVILVGLPVFTVQVLDAPAWLAGALYATYTVIIALGQTSVVRRLEGHRRTRALMFAAVLWAMSFLLLASASLLPPVLLAGFLFVVTGLYTAAVVLHAGVIDALVVEAAPDRLRARYVGVYHLSWAVANAMAPGLFSILLSWQPTLPWIALALLLLLAAVGVWMLEARLVQAAVRPTARMRC